MSPAASAAAPSQPAPPARDDKNDMLWAFNILGAKKRDVRISKDEFDILAKQSKELYTKYKEKKNTEMQSKVSKAWEIIKSHKEKHGLASAAPARTVSSSSATGRSAVAKASTALPGRTKAAASSSSSRRPLTAPAAAPKAPAPKATPIVPISSPGGGSTGGHTPLSRTSSFNVCTCGESFSLPFTITRGDGAFLCPGCRIRRMDPFNEVLEGKRGLMKLVVFQPPYVPNDGRSEHNIEFKLDLSNLKEWKKKSQNIEARMVFLDSCDLKQHWPNELSCSVVTTVNGVRNENQVFRIDPPKSGHKRRDVPESMTIKIKAAVSKFRINVKDNEINKFALAIVRTSPRPVRELCTTVAIETVDDSQRRIKDILFGSQLMSTGEEVFASGSDRSNLICPLTHVRMGTPARGFKCQHLQCFDLEAYFNTNLNMPAFNSRWLCPVCNSLLLPKDIFVDAYVLKILQEAEENAEEITFSKDASWEVTAYASPPPTPSEDEAPASAAADDDDDDVVEAIEPAKTPMSEDPPVIVFNEDDVKTPDDEVALDKEDNEVAPADTEDVDVMEDAVESDADELHQQQSEVAKLERQRAEKRKREEEEQERLRKEKALKVVQDTQKMLKGVDAEKLKLLKEQMAKLKSGAADAKNGKPPQAAAAPAAARLAPPVAVAAARPAAAGAAATKPPASTPVASKTGTSAQQKVAEQAKKPLTALEQKQEEARRRAREVEAKKEREEEVRKKKAEEERLLRKSRFQGQIGQAIAKAVG